MLTDEWTFETTTPYPLQYAYTTVVDDLIYLFDPKFESNETRPNEGLTYNTSSKAWRYVTRMPFVYIGRLRTCVNNGKIYMTGANDGMQINVIQVYDTRTNEWEEPILITDYQLNIHKLICKDSAILAIGEQVKKEKSVVYIPGKRELHNAKVFTLHRNGSVQKDVWAIDYYQMHQSVVQDSVMYLLDHKDEEQYVLAKVNIDTHERQELGTINIRVFRPMFFPFHDSFFLFGGRRRSPFLAASPAQTRKRRIQRCSCAHLTTNLSFLP